ncbi:MAG: rhodanese-like domain-containing protein [Balneolia bacterium]|nr:rhodanese-like domain-containing protein [Balneolia bacterium]
MFNFFNKSANDIDISSDDFRQKLENERGVVIDVRTAGENSEGQLKITDTNLDVLNGEFQKAITEMDKDKTYYLYCRSGNRSGQAARMMKQEGFENVFNVGGFDGLVRDGFEAK